jgi:hypothetical protein
MQEGMAVAIASPDKDFLQLLRPGIILLRPPKKPAPGERVNKYALVPYSEADFEAVRRGGLGRNGGGGADYGGLLHWSFTSAYVLGCRVADASSPRCPAGVRPAPPAVCRCAGAGRGCLGCAPRCSSPST